MVAHQLQVGYQAHSPPVVCWQDCLEQEGLDACVKLVEVVGPYCDVLSAQGSDEVNPDWPELGLRNGRDTGLTH